MLDETQIGQNINNMAKGAGNAAMAGVSAVAAAPGMVANAVGEMNKQNRQAYNRDQSKRSAGRYNQKQTPEAYNQGIVNNMMGVEEPKAPSNVLPEIARKHLHQQQVNRRNGTAPAYKQIVPNTFGKPIDPYNRLGRRG